jgi:hypothetical protein
MKPTKRNREALPVFVRRNIKTGRTSVIFEDRRTKRNRTRSQVRQNVLHEAS